MGKCLPLLLALLGSQSNFSATTTRSWNIPASDSSLFSALIILRGGVDSDDSGKETYFRSRNQAGDLTDLGSPMALDTPIVNNLNSNMVTPIPKRTSDSMDPVRKLRFDSPEPDSVIKPRVRTGHQQSASHDSMLEESPLLNTPMPRKVCARTPTTQRDDVTRINAFAIGDHSPITALPASDRGGVGRLRMSAGLLTSGSSFSRDFFDIKEIGRGEHGTVYSCVRKIDLWPYAVKVVETRGGGAERERALQEIYALAAQGDNPSAVRYHSAWEEGGAVYIQTELCAHNLLDAGAAGRGLGPMAAGAGAGGASHPRQAPAPAADRAPGGPQPFAAAELWWVAGEVAAALRYMHGHGVAHFDVKVPPARPSQPPQVASGSESSQRPTVRPGPAGPQTAQV